MKVNTMMVFTHCPLSRLKIKDCESIHFYQSERIDFWQLIHCTQIFLQLPGWPFSEPLALHWIQAKRKKLRQACDKTTIKQKKLDTQYYAHHDQFCKYLPAPTITIFWFTKSDNGRPWDLTVPNNPASATPAVPYRTW